MAQPYSMLQQWECDFQDGFQDGLHCRLQIFFSAQVEVYRGPKRKQTELMLFSQMVEWFKAEHVSALQYDQGKN